MAWTISKVPGYAHGYSKFVDTAYQHIVQTLHAASNQHCPVTTDSFFKSHWDEEMSVLKHRSIDTHLLWVNCGRPRCGPIYRDRCRARAEYRRSLKFKSKIASSRISNDLHEQLLEKDSVSFWKTWKNKVNKRKAVASCIDGCFSAPDIANKFATSFQKACLPNDSDRNDKLKRKFESQFNTYCPNTEMHFISVELVDKCIRDMKLGKAAGIDGVETEHLRYAHPRICVMLSLLFNAMLVHGMVPSMFGIGIIVPLLKGHDLDGSVSENYRGITLSVHISKVFEMCIMEIHSDFFVTSDLQFGFKKRLGCSHSLYTVKSVVQHFTSGNSTVNLCALDMSKAFDKLNHYALFLKLMDRNVPLALMNVLINWYGMCSAVVRWDGVFSAVVQLCCGVRQGGVLSPVLFSVYVNDIITVLSKSGHGCYFDNIFIGCVFYADDLLLLSASLCDLQCMIDICCYELAKLDMCLNAKKSQVVRIGKSHSNDVNNVVIYDKPINCVHEMKYLGWYILSGNKFRVSLHHMRVRFFQCFNALYAKSCDFSEPVLQHLVNVNCKPYLLYGADVINWSKAELSSIRHAFNSSMCKIYKVSFHLLDVIYQYSCQSDILCDISDRQRRFLLNAQCSSNLVLQFLAIVGS